MSVELKILRSDGSVEEIISSGTVVPAPTPSLTNEYVTNCGLPVLYLSGDMTGISKENEVTLSYVYKEFSGSCTLKWQGSSSLAWDKKNFTIKFDTKFEAVSGWGAQKKYCLKANWIDHTHSRNVVNAKLWGLIRRNAPETPAHLKALPNAGAVDGFPVVIMFNDEFYGLYTFNIPKDEWMFNMGNGTKEAFISADNQAADTAFKAETLLDADGLELEYSSDTFSEEEVKSSINTLIRACINSNGGDLDTTIAQYLDWESAIDYYIFTVVLKGGDMIQKNAMYLTLDGTKWYFSAYDLDTTYGLAFDGSALDRAVSNVNFVEAANSHRVFELIKRFKTNKLKARYKELRSNYLSESRICQYFENFAWKIPAPLLIEESKRWPSVRGTSVNGIDQICRWIRQRLEATDAWLDALPAQETPSVTPDVVNYSITNKLTNCATSNTANTAVQNSSYSTAISANAGYTLDGATISITMGGTDITSTAYNNGVITISKVTGNIIITVAAIESAEEPSGYINLVPTSIDKDGATFGEDYNGDGKKDGYKNNYRVSSSGAIKAEGGGVCTGYMKIEPGVTLRIKGVVMDDGTSKAIKAIAFYKQDFTHLGTTAYQPTGTHYGICLTTPPVLTVNGDISIITVPQNSDIYWCVISGAGTSGENMIVTKNQEIT